MKDLTV